MVTKNEIAVLAASEEEVSSRFRMNWKGVFLSNESERAIELLLEQGFVLDRRKVFVVCSARSDNGSWAVLLMTAFGDRAIYEVSFSNHTNLVDIRRYSETKHSVVQGVVSSNGVPTPHHRQ